jgi:hypothetical protein
MSSLGDAKCSLGDSKSSLGDATSLLGDAKSFHTGHSYHSYGSSGAVNQSLEVLQDQHQLQHQQHPKNPNQPSVNVRQLENQVAADDFPNHEPKEVFRTICKVIGRFLKVRAPPRSLRS